MKKFLLHSLVLLVLLFPAISVGQEDSLFVCEGWDCQACDLVELGNTIINFVIMMSVIIATILLAYAGFLIVTAQGDMGKIKHAREMFTNIVIGIIIVLSGWLIVNTVMKLLVGDDLLGDGPWYEIECVEQPAIVPPSTVADGTTVVPGGPSVPAPSAGCPNCATIVADGVTCKAGVNCTVDAEYAKNLGLLGKDFPLIVTEGFPPKANHKAACHRNGTCLDVVFSDRNFSDQNKINNFISAADRAGYRAVYEPNKGQACPPGMGKSCQANVANGTHFSLYKK